jgi:hypothetical protein
MEERGLPFIQTYSSAKNVSYRVMVRHLDKDESAYSQSIRFRDRLFRVNVEVISPERYALEEHYSIEEPVLAFYVSSRQADPAQGQKKTTSEPDEQMIFVQFPQIDRL